MTSRLNVKRLRREIIRIDFRATTLHVNAYHRELIVRIVANVGKPVECPLRAEIGIVEGGGLLAFSLVVCSRKIYFRPVRSDASDGRIDNVQAGELGMNGISSHPSRTGAGASATSTASIVASSYFFVALGCFGIRCRSWSRRRAGNDVKDRCRASVANVVTYPGTTSHPG